MAIEVLRAPDIGLEKFDAEKAKLQGTLAIKTSPAYSRALMRPKAHPPPKLYHTTLVAIYEVKAGDKTANIEFWKAHALFDMEGEHFDRMDYMHFVDGDMETTSWSVDREFWILFPGVEVDSITEIKNA